MLGAYHIGVSNWKIALAFTSASLSLLVQLPLPLFPNNKKFFVTVAWCSTRCIKVFYVTVVLIFSISIVCCPDSTFGKDCKRKHINDLQIYDLHYHSQPVPVG